MITNNDIRFSLEDAEASVNTARNLLLKNDTQTLGDHLQYAQESLARLRKALEKPAEVEPADSYPDTVVS